MGELSSTDASCCSSRGCPWPGMWACGDAAGLAVAAGRRFVSPARPRLPGVHDMPVNSQQGSNVDNVATTHSGWPSDLV